MLKPSLIGTTSPHGAQSNLSVADHVDPARSAIASLRQTGTVTTYTSAFNILLACLGADNAYAGQQVLWWNQGLEPFLATATAINPLTLDRFTVLADARRAVVAVDSSRMPTSAAASGTSNLDANASSYKGKSRQSLHPTQQTRPAEATGHNKGSLVGNNQQRPAAAVASQCDTIPAIGCLHGFLPGQACPHPQHLGQAYSTAHSQHLLGQGLLWHEPNTQPLAKLPKDGSPLLGLGPGLHGYCRYLCAFPTCLKAWQPAASIAITVSCLVVEGFAITALMLRQPHPVSQSTGFSELPAADSAQCSIDLLNLQGCHLLPQCFADIHSLSGKSFTLDTAANSSGDNAHCPAFCGLSNSFLSKLHTGHNWIHAHSNWIHCSA